MYLVATRHDDGSIVGRVVWAISVSSIIYFQSEILTLQGLHNVFNTGSWKRQHMSRKVGGDARRQQFPLPWRNGALDLAGAPLTRPAWASARCRRDLRLQPTLPTLSRKCPFLLRFLVISWEICESHGNKTFISEFDRLSRTPQGL